MTQQVPQTPAKDRILDRWMGPRLSQLWLGPTLAACLCLLTMGTLLWLTHQHDLMEHAQEFESDVDSALRSVTLHLQHNQEHLALLAAKFARGVLKAQTFQDEVFAFVRDNPELEHVILTDADFIVLRVVPDANTGRLPGRGRSPTESFRAYLRAQATHQSTHTRLFEIRQGQVGFAVYVPIRRDDALLGTIGGIYTCERFLRHTVPRHVLENNRVSLVSEHDSLSCSLGDVTHVDDDFVRDVEFTLSQQGIWLRLQGYEGDLFETEGWLLIALCVILTLGMAYGMVVLARYAAERQQAQQVLRRERDNLVNVFEAMADGVAIVSTQLDLQYVNPVLVKDFGPYEDRKCYEYFHGHSEPCEACMMGDIIAGKTVHTEWCYPRNERTYDLIDSRVNNPDGSISKLKIFRDITERVEATAALEESEQRFHQLFERAADALFLYDVDGRIVDVNQTACDTLGYTRDEFQALTMSDICLDCGSGPLQQLLQSDSPATPRLPTTLLARPCRKDGSSFPVEVRLGCIEYRGEPLVLASARDITEREAAERAIKQRLEAERAAAEQTRLRLEESESLHRVTTALLQKITLEEVLDVVCQESQRLTGATGSGVLLLENSDFLRLTNWTGEPPPRAERLPVEGSFGGLAVERGVPLFIADLTQYDLACYRQPLPDSLIVVPLKAAGNTIGVLDVAGQMGTFDPSDIRVLSHFADQAAIAIEKARLREQAEQVAVMEERHRLARELHDSVTQALYSISLYADAASLAIGSGKADVAAKHMETLRSLAREAMLEMRLLIFELHPPTLENEGLAGAIGTRLATVEARAGLETEITVTGNGDSLSAEIEGALYRFAQEALNNVIKHAKAHRVCVRIQFETGFVTLEVADDGIGFDQAEAAQTGGIGLKGMRERMERLGGRVVVQSSPGKGASLMAEVDL